MERARPARPSDSCHSFLISTRRLRNPLNSCSQRALHAAVSDFTNVVGSMEQVCACLPAVEETLAVHLLLSLASSWKAWPVLHTKPRRTTSALIGKSYMAGGQAERDLWLNRAVGQRLHGFYKPYNRGIPPCFRAIHLASTECSLR